MTQEPSSICIIDDEAQLLGLLEQALSQEGHDVNAFPDEDAFLEFAAVQQPDLLLLDLTLPQHGAWRLHEHLGQDADLEGTPVIGITDRAHASLQASATETLGFQGLLEKPFSMADLLEATRDALEPDG